MKYLKTYESDEFGDPSKRISDDEFIDIENVFIELIEKYNIPEYDDYNKTTPFFPRDIYYRINRYEKSRPHNTLVGNRHNLVEINIRCIPFGSFDISPTRKSRVISSRGKNSDAFENDLNLFMNRIKRFGYNVDLTRHGDLQDRIRISITK